MSKGAGARGKWTNQYYFQTVLHKGLLLSCFLKAGWLSQAISVYHIFTIMSRPDNTFPHEQGPLRGTRRS